MFYVVVWWRFRLTACARPGLYHSCFTTPYTQLTQSLASATFKATTHAAAVSTPDADEATSILGWLRKKTERKIPAVLKSGTKADKVRGSNFTERAKRRKATLNCAQPCVVVA